MESLSNTIIRLYAKHLTGEKLNDSEKKLIRDRLVQQGLVDIPEAYAEDLKLFTWLSDRKQAAWERLENKLFDQEAALPVLTVPNRNYGRLLAWLAAAVIIVIGIAKTAHFFLPAGPEEKAVQPVTKKQAEATIDDSTIFVVLEDNTRVPVKPNQPGVVAIQGNTTLKVMEDGRLTYIAGPHTTHENDAYNIIQVPRGKQFDLVLPDGTTVSLNAASNLKYPVTFGARERQVELSGEARFNVRKNKAQPFIVSADKMKVEVTGTSFNVKAYKDEKNMAVTLLEGAVNITIPGKTGQLKPLEQMIVTDSAMKLIPTVDSTEVMAWKKKLFHYNNRELKIIMDEIARWYKVEVAYEGENQEVKFMMQHVPRDWSLERVLSVLERTGDLRFKFDGKKITVLK